MAPRPGYYATSPESDRQFFSSVEITRFSEEALHAFDTEDCVCEFFGSDERCKPHHDCGESVHWLIAAAPFLHEMIRGELSSLTWITEIGETLCAGHGPAYAAAWELADTFVREDEIRPSRAVDMALVTVGP